SEAGRLFRGREGFELRCFEPPGVVRFEEVHRLGPQLIARLSHAVDVNRADASEWPKSSCAGWVAQIAAVCGWINSASEYALSWHVDRVLTPWRTVTIIPAGYE